MEFNGNMSSNTSPNYSPHQHGYNINMQYMPMMMPPYNSLNQMQMQPTSYYNETSRLVNNNNNNNTDSNNSNNNNNETSKAKLYKTELCNKWMSTGECRYGHKCQFAHGEDDLRQVSRHPKYKTKECKTFQSKGYCRYGIRCRFLHEGVEEDKLAGISGAHIPAPVLDKQSKESITLSKMEKAMENVNLQAGKPNEKPQEDRIESYSSNDDSDDSYQMNTLGSRMRTVRTTPDRLYAMDRVKQTSRMTNSISSQVLPTFSIPAIRKEGFVSNNNYKSEQDKMNATAQAFGKNDLNLTTNTFSTDGLRNSTENGSNSGMLGMRHSQSHPALNHLGQQQWNSEHTELYESEMNISLNEQPPLIPSKSGGMRQSLSATALHQIDIAAGLKPQKLKNSQSSTSLVDDELFNFDDKPSDSANLRKVSTYSHNLSSLSDLLNDDYEDFGSTTGGGMMRTKSQGTRLNMFAKLSSQTDLTQLDR